VKIKPKLALSFLLLCLAPLAVSGLVSSTMAERALSRQVLRQLESVATIQKSRLDDIFDQNLERLRLIATRTQLRRNLSTYLVKRDQALQAGMDAILADGLTAVAGFKEITVLDPAGLAVASTEPAHLGGSHAGTPHFERGLKGPCVDIFFLDPSGRLRCRLSGPLVWEGRLVGVVLIDTAAENVTGLVADYSGLGKTGETMIARRIGPDQVVYIAPLRFDPEAALRRAVDSESGDPPMAAALEGREALLSDSLDYRGKRVLAATRFLPDYGLGLVVKLDRDEAFAPMVELRHTLMLVTGLSALLVLVLSIPVGRTLSGPILDLAEVARRVSAGDFTQRAEARGADEIGDLARGFNSMTAKLTEDIERRRRAEEQLRSRTALLQGIIDNSLSAIFVKDVDQRFIMVNKVFEDLCGKARDDILGRTTAEVFPPELAMETAEHDRRVLETGAALQHERTYTQPGGSRTYIATKFPLYTQQGDPYALCGIYTDISEVKRAAAMREEVERMIRHDLKSPLMAIAGLPGVMKNEANITDRQREMLSAIEEAGRRMLEIIGLSQDLYRMETGTYRLDPAPVDLLAVARRVLADGAWLAERHHLDLHLFLDGRPAADADAVQVAGREPLLYTMLANLVGNAMDAAGREAAVNLALDTEGGWVRLTVRNPGAVPWEIRDRFFEKYVSAGKKTGTGIGTYNAKLIAEAHGGSIAMRTADGEGTEVTVRLPRHAASA
jgi:PAS domain S-box-containing protein